MPIQINPVRHQFAYQHIRAQLNQDPGLLDCARRLKKQSPDGHLVLSASIYRDSVVLRLYVMDESMIREPVVPVDTNSDVYWYQLYEGDRFLTVATPNTEQARCGNVKQTCIILNYVERLNLAA